MLPRGVARHIAFVEVFTLRLKWQIPAAHGVFVALLRCSLPSQCLMQVIATILFLLFFFCQSHFGLHWAIARNLRRRMLIKRQFHFVIWTTLKHHSLHEFPRASHHLPPLAFWPHSL